MCFVSIVFVHTYSSFDGITGDDVDTPSLVEGGSDNVESEKDTSHSSSLGIAGANGRRRGKSKQVSGGGQPPLVRTSGARGRGRGTAVATDNSSSLSQLTNGANASGLTPAFDSLKMSGGIGFNPLSSIGFGSPIGTRASRYCSFVVCLINSHKFTHTHQSTVCTQARFLCSNIAVFFISLHL